MSKEINLFIHHSLKQPDVMFGQAFLMGHTAFLELIYTHPQKETLLSPVSVSKSDVLVSYSTSVSSHEFA